MRVCWVLLLMASVGLSGRDASGQASSRVVKGERYALVVGVRKYDPNELRALPYSEADANGMAKVLRDGGYKRDNVVLMTQVTGAEDLRFLPTADRIRKELTLLATDCQPADTVIVALAGHGVQFRGELESYFCPADARLADKSTLLPLSEVYQALDRCPAGFKLLLVDACRNDPLSSNARSREVVTLESISRPQSVPPPGGVSALFSCSAGEKAFEHDELKHGVFFHYVIESLTGAAAPLDGTEGVTLPELEVFVKRHVRDFVRAKYGVRQMPERVGVERGLVPLVNFDPAARALRRGLDFARRKEYDAAITSLDEALRFNPKLIPALKARGDAKSERHDYNAAIDDYNAAFLAGGADASLYRLRAAAYARTHQLEWALADANEAVRQDPKNPRSYSSRSHVLNEKGESDRSILDCNEALRLDPNYANAYINRARAYLRKGDYDRAIADTSEAIRLDPKISMAYNNRGYAYRQKNDYDRAFADYNEAIRLDPRSVLAYSNRGFAYNAKSEFDRAIVDFNEAIRIDPRHATAYNGRGNAYDRKGDYTHALADYDAALRIEPANATFTKNRANTFARASGRR